MTTLDELFRRVQWLERSNRRLRVILTGLGLGGATILLMGTVSSPGSVPPVLEAQRVVLKDTAGHERGSLFVTDQSWGLVLYNRDSSKAAALVVTDYGSSVLVNDGHGKSGMAMFAQSDESSLAMFDANQKARIELKNNANGSALGFRDGNGTDRVDVAFTPHDGGGIVMNDANSAPRTLLGEREPGLMTFDAKGGFLWAAGLDGFDEDTQKRIRQAADALSRSK
jgi:hypothetical protein